MLTGENESFAAVAGTATWSVNRYLHDIRFYVKWAGKRLPQMPSEALSQQGVYMGKQFLKVVEAKSALSGMRQ